MRLIDADELCMDVLGRLTIVSPNVVQYANGVVNLIANAPTIEAEPVRHGRWELVTTKCVAAKYVRVGYCQNCNEERLVDNYCSNCGAKMTEV